MANQNQIISDATTAGGFKLKLVITDTSGTPISGLPTITIDFPTLATIIANYSLTNKAVGWQYEEGYDASNSCVKMKRAVLATAWEPA